MSGSRSARRRCVEARTAARGFRRLARQPGWYRRRTTRRRVLPDFFIVGAQRAGTTSLYRYLKQHPQIEASIWKEVHFFDRDSNYSRGADWYRAHFETRQRLARRARKGGLAHLSFEATPAYMYRPAAISRMAELLPDARLIVLLRDPVERAFSNYKSAQQKGSLSTSFAELIDREQAWIEAGLRERGVAETRQFLERGIYVEQLERIFRFYPRDQVLVLSSEEMFADPQSVCDQVFEFLGLPETRVNVAGIANRSEEKAMSAETRRGLVEFFEPYNLRLYALLQRDFGWPSRGSTSRPRVREPDVIAYATGAETARLDSVAEGVAQAFCAGSFR